MLLDSHNRKLVTERCWTIYELINNNFNPFDEFHLRFPDIVEIALAAGLLRFSVNIEENQYSLYIREEYKFDKYELKVKSYSYNLVNTRHQNLLRADSLPHHKVDYKNNKLKCFPHHLHDENGRICSFSGELTDFIKRSSVLPGNIAL